MAIVGIDWRVCAARVIPANHLAPLICNEGSSRSPMFRTYLLRTISFDGRSLALFRIMLGCIVLVDLLDRSTVFAAMYTEVGLPPLADLRTIYGRDRQRSSRPVGIPEFLEVSPNFRCAMARRTTVVFDQERVGAVVLSQRPGRNDDWLVVNMTGPDLAVLNDGTLSDVAKQP